MQIGEIMLVSMPLIRRIMNRLNLLLEIINRIGRYVSMILRVWKDWTTEQRQLRSKFTGAVGSTTDREKE